MTQSLILQQLVEAVRRLSRLDVTFDRPTEKQLGMLNGTISEILKPWFDEAPVHVSPIDKRKVRLHVLAELIGRNIATSKYLTRREVSVIIDLLLKEENHEPIYELARSTQT